MPALPTKNSQTLSLEAWREDKGCPVETTAQGVTEQEREVEDSFSMEAELGHHK